MNICLNSMLILNLLKSEPKKGHSDKKEALDKNIAIHNVDYLDSLKDISKKLANMAEEFRKLNSG